MSIQVLLFIMLNLLMKHFVLHVTGPEHSSHPAEGENVSHFKQI